jgi:hypothetical protein
MERRAIGFGPDVSDTLTDTSRFSGCRACTPARASFAWSPRYSFDRRSRMLSATIAFWSSLKLRRPA